MLTSNNIYTRISGGIAKIVFLAVMFIVPLYSCTDDGTSPEDAASPERELVTATLKLDIASYDQTDSTGTRSYVAANSDECILNNIWVFQYDAETGESLKNPVYISSPDSSNIEIDLYLNETGDSSLVCIVANAGQYADDGYQWALGSAGLIRDEFSTYSSFLEQAIPAAATEAFISSNMGKYGRTIPMFGVSKRMTIKENSYVSVSLVRMFAKVKVEVDISSYTALGMSISDLKLSNIPEYCRVSTLETDDLSTAASYPSTATWSYYDAGNVTEVTLYLPENLQGTVEGMTSKQEATEGFPTNALYIDLTMKYNDGANEHTYTIYPGLDMDNDFNIKRNHIYNVSVSINNLPE